MKGRLNGLNSPYNLIPKITTNVLQQIVKELFLINIFNLIP
uniref:Uncharacterized protein n=1 Tax=uncultured bacterium BLR12 TaxID=506514 RepID=C0ING2_9BACT|nr:hypothetical protein AKSOIL_0233 [uncultured bacterium BLR12]